MYNEFEFLNSISESFALSKKHGARSTQKLMPIHKYVTEMLKGIWGGDYKFAFRRY